MITWWTPFFNKLYDYLGFPQDKAKLPSLMEHQQACYPKALTNQVVIDLATFQDLDVFEDLQDQAYQGYIPWSKADFIGEWTSNPYAFYLVIRSGDSVVGLASGRIRHKDSHLSHLILVPAYQGQGLGQVLLREWMSVAKLLGSQQVSLELRASNQTAQMVYQKLGFKEVGRKQDYYLDNQETAIQMVRRFEEE